MSAPAQALPPADRTPHVVLGVGASVAIHRALDLCSGLRRAGYELTVLMTPGATKLVSPLQFGALSGSRVLHEVFAGAGEDVYDHLRPAREGDLFVLCPATADLIARIAHGLGDDLVATTALAWHGPALLVPAMNWRMWANPRVTRNVAILEGDGFERIGPEAGDLACGEEGPGRMAAVETVLERIATLLPPHPI